GIAVLHWRLSADPDGKTRPGAGDDDEPLRNAGHLLLLASRKPSADRSLIAFAAWSSFAHATVIGVQASLNLIALRELLGVATFIVIGSALMALAPAKQPVERSSTVAV